MDNDTERLQIIQDYYTRHRVIPAYRHMGAMIGMASSNAVSQFVKRLRLQGYIQKTPDGRLAPTMRFFERPLVGKAPAGFASPATELLGDVISIDDYLVEHPSKTVLVEVRGDSMIDTGIHDGDFLIVERNSNPNIGKIVVAIVDGDFTIKYLRTGNRGPYLEPANEQFPDIYPETSLDIYGEVVGQFRKFG
jgi:repressor LexA